MGWISKLKNSIASPGSPVSTGKLKDAFGIQISPVSVSFPLDIGASAYDPVQKLIAVGTRGGHVHICGGRGVHIGLTSEKSAAPIYLMSFIINQGALVTVSQGNLLQLWDLEKQCVMDYVELPAYATSICYPPASSVVYISLEVSSSDTHSAVVVYNIEKSYLSTYSIEKRGGEHTIDGLSGTSSVGEIVDVSVVPTDDSMLCILCDKAILLWSLPDRKITKRIALGNAMGQGTAISFSWHFSGKHGFIGTTSGQILVVHFKNGKVKPVALSVSLRSVHQMYSWKVHSDGGGSDTQLLFMATGGDETMSRQLYTVQLNDDLEAAVDGEPVNTCEPIANDITSFHVDTDNFWIAAGHVPSNVLVMYKNGTAGSIHLQDRNGVLHFEMPNAMDYTHPVPTSWTSSLVMSPSESLPQSIFLKVLNSMRAMARSIDKHWLSKRASPLSGGSCDAQLGGSFASDVSIVIVGYPNGELLFFEWHSSIRHMVRLCELKLQADIPIEAMCWWHTGADAVVLGVLQGCSVYCVDLTSTYPQFLPAVDTPAAVAEETAVASPSHSVESSGHGTSPVQVSNPDMTEPSTSSSEPTVPIVSNMSLSNATAERDDAADAYNAMMARIRSRHSSQSGRSGDAEPTHVTNRHPPPSAALVDCEDPQSEDIAERKAEPTAIPVSSPEKVHSHIWWFKDIVRHNSRLQMEACIVLVDAFALFGLPDDPEALQVVTLSCTATEHPTISVYDASSGAESREAVVGNGKSGSFKHGDSDSEDSDSETDDSILTARPELCCGTVDGKVYAYGFTDRGVLFIVDMSSLSVSIVKSQKKTWKEIPHTTILLLNSRGERVDQGGSMTLENEVVNVVIVHHSIGTVYIYDRLMKKCLSKFKDNQLQLHDVMVSVSVSGEPMLVVTDDDKKLSPFALSIPGLRADGIETSGTSHWLEWPFVDFPDEGHSLLVTPRVGSDGAGSMFILHDGLRGLLTAELADLGERSAPAQQRVGGCSAFRAGLAYPLKPQSKSFIKSLFSSSDGHPPSSYSPKVQALFQQRQRVQTEKKTVEAAKTATSDVKAVLSEAREALERRGEKLHDVAEKSSQLADSANDFLMNIRALTKAQGKKSGFF